MQWIVVTGGNLSGLGKGIVSASIAKLLEPYKIVNVKCDGYLNVDPGTINPFEHGEVFVLEDGGEVDMDFGHYERFTNTDSKFSHNLTSGKIFDAVISKERKGEYLGKTVQIFPHMIDEIKQRLLMIAEEEKPEVMMVEIGGTIDDIEESWFIRAIRELSNELGEHMIFCHLAYAPMLSGVEEVKTRLVQTSVESLLQKGIRPDIVICRADKRMTAEAKEKIARFCGIAAEAVMSDPYLETIYELPLMFEEEGLRRLLERKLGLQAHPQLEKWRELVQRIKNKERTIPVAICGKYTGLKDSYASIMESVVHAGAFHKVHIQLHFMDTTDIASPEDAKQKLAGMQGIIIPGGFGRRGTEGKIQVAQYARENNIPYLGLCLGLQIAVIEFARNVCGLKGANSTEFAAEGAIVNHPVIDILPGQRNVSRKGATMRLGAYTASLQEGTSVHALYGSTKVSERHRHRYEVNPQYHDILQQRGMIFSGTSTDEDGTLLVEFIELPNQVFRGTQAHPEFKSRLTAPAPLFVGFVGDIVRQRV
ncbi:CTP synthase [Candidatus Woesearchaeota archaeon]|nr:CTP synthase [Candidatus Woesearchaeota archaeon]